MVQKLKSNKKPEDTIKIASSDLHPHKLIVGLTGTFGSGKSTVAHLLEELGALVIDADLLAHETMMEGNQEYKKLAQLFKEARLVDGTGLDRKKIAAIVFRDPEKRKKLEDIVHPYVFRRMLELMSDASEKIVILEVPLLFETRFDQYCHETLVVKNTNAQIVKRLEEDGFTKKDIEARIKAQMPLEEKCKRATYLIDNSGALEQTRQAVLKLWKKWQPAQKVNKIKGEK